MKKFLLSLLSFAFSAPLLAQPAVRVIGTSDVHGNYLPYDFISQRPWGGGLSRVATYVKQQRQTLGSKRVVLLDNGDILQGQPTAYFYNYIDTTQHLCADALNYLRYDAGTVGNHDVETGHAVYDRWTSQCRFPLLAANAIDTQKGTPYWQPYTLLEREGLRIAILGLITPSIPEWLPENLWSGLRFEDMVATAQKYMPILREQERADIVIGVFHSGVGSAKQSGAMRENAALQVAKEVVGFDLVLCGHDHRVNATSVVNVAGDTVTVLNPGANAFYVAEADIYKGKRPRVVGRVVRIEELTPDADYLQHFAQQHKAVAAFTQKKIGRLNSRLETRSSYFGSSAFIDLIHTMQLRIGEADISFAAPLALDATIEAGDISVADMFNLYKFENLLYTMRLSGKEIKDYLEYSYDHWVRTMKSPQDTMLLFRQGVEQIAEPWQRLQHPAYNFDCAGGLKYTVDLRKKKGSRIRILGLANGRPFDLQKNYRVAVNSYRGNGGGGLLTAGAGIAKEELPQRVLQSTRRDLRYYLMETIKKDPVLSPKALHHWHFIPQKWVQKARQRDERLLFR